MSENKVSIIKKLKERANKLKNEVMALYLAYKRRDVPWYAKVVLILVVGYAISPIDLIPDFIPILGYLDDILLLPLGISLAIKLVPKHILDECRVEAEEALKDWKPNKWIAGAIIILIWIVIGALIAISLFK